MLSEIKLDFDDVLIVPQISNILSRSEVNLNSNTLKNLLHIDTCGIIAANMDGIGTFEVAKTLKKYGVMTALIKHYPLDELVDHFGSEDSSHSWYTLGLSEHEFSKFTKFIEKYNCNDNLPLKIQVDVPNGYMSGYPDYIRRIRETVCNSIIMAGNVVEITGVKHLSEADIVSLGIGSGSNCLTRTQTGIGYPQFSAIYDTCQARMDKSPLICSDGGCVSPGDVAKAFGAGAHMVMLGGMLAGTVEGGGELEIDRYGNSVVKFYGMSSKTAQLKYVGEVRPYRSSEGRTTMVPFKGHISDVIENILGGLRSACTYTNSNDIDELKINSKFIRVNNVINKSMEKYTIGN